LSEGFLWRKRAGFVLTKELINFTENLIPMELTINIKQENKLKFVTELLNSLSYVEIKSVSEKEEKKKKVAKVSPTMLFGKWKDLEIDAKELRKNSWRKI
jgi:hypothetical protein